VQKRFNDFKKLHEQLQASNDYRAQNTVKLPAFQGAFAAFFTGILASAGRRSDLQEYMNKLVSTEALLSLLLKDKQF